MAEMVLVALLLLVQVEAVLAQQVQTQRHLPEAMEEMELRLPSLVLLLPTLVAVGAELMEQHIRQELGELEAAVMGLRKIPLLQPLERQILVAVAVEADQMLMAQQAAPA